MTTVAPTTVPDRLLPESPMEHATNKPRDGRQFIDGKWRAAGDGATNVVLPRLNDKRGTIIFTGASLAVSPAASATTLSIGLAARRAFALALFEDQQPAGVHAATVTIFGAIGTSGFEAEQIARSYLELHHQSHDQWTPEMSFTGAAQPLTVGS